MISLDTEATGLDCYHGARPYFVTTCTEQGDVTFWPEVGTWPVNPLTREVTPDPDDVEAIRALLKDEQEKAIAADKEFAFVLQNVKYDCAMLKNIGIEEFPWGFVEDTLIAGHVLASNRPHDLINLALEYVIGETGVGYDIKPVEDTLKEAVLECRRRVQQARLARKRGKPKGDDDLADWAIADKNRATIDMPSVGSEDWKADGWLPWAMAERDRLPANHRYRSVLQNYANMDAEATILAWREMEKEIKRRGHWKHYRERMKSLPILYGMENRGTTFSEAEVCRARTEYTAKADTAAERCRNIAFMSYSYDLDLPNGSRNNSLLTFVFDVMKLEKRYNPKSKTGDPCFDSKIAIPYYIDTLPTGSARLQFVKAFVERGLHSKAVDFLDSYELYGVKGDVPGWRVLHPTFNGAGTILMRRSCSDPNLQQVGKKKEANLRRCLGPAPGREWWSLDYKNLELRIPAYEAGEKELIDLFEHPDDPPYYGSEHILNFETVYPDKWAEAVKIAGLEGAAAWIKSEEGWADTWYQWCKNGDFAVGYGAIDRPDGYGTADRTFRRPGSHARLKARFAKKEAHNQWCIRFANRYGYIETIPDKTVDPEHGYPLLCTRTDYGDVLPTVPLNFRTQGSAGWIQMKAMTRIQPRLDTWTSADPRGYYMILEVHDELVFDFPAGTGKEPWRTNLSKILEIAALMEQSGDDLGIPTPVDISYHPKNWADEISITKAMRQSKPSSGPGAWLANRNGVAHAKV